MKRIQVGENSGVKQTKNTVEKREGSKSPILEEDSSEALAIRNLRGKRKLVKEPNSLACESTKHRIERNIFPSREKSFSFYSLEKGIYFSSVEQGLSIAELDNLTAIARASQAAQALNSKKSISVSNAQASVSNAEIPISNAEIPISNTEIPISNAEIPISNAEIPSAEDSENDYKDALSLASSDAYGNSEYNYGDSEASENDYRDSSEESDYTDSSENCDVIAQAPLGSISSKRFKMVCITKQPFFPTKAGTCNSYSLIVSLIVAVGTVTLFGIILPSSKNKSVKLEFPVRDNLSNFLEFS